MSEFKKVLNNLGIVYDKLQDEESKSIYKARWDYIVKRDINKLQTTLLSSAKDIECDDFESFMKLHNYDKKIVIFGAGNDGIQTYHILKLLGRTVIAFCDNNRYLYGTNLFQLPVVMPEELIDTYQGCIVVIASQKYLDTIFEQLIELNIPKNNIYYPRYKKLYATWGWQYFDLPYMQPEDDEVFVDAGAFDGMTTVDFVKWCGGNYNKIYAFEPNPLDKEKCLETFEKYMIKNVKYVPKATWSSKEKLKFFSNNALGASISSKGTDIIDAIDIDTVLDGEKATFIKMDVEGSELSSLIGAKKTICRYKPKLAICVYHKPEDIIEIPSYILSLVPEYKFYLRHYSSSDTETVLYAFCK